jgi:hypothetical protein
MLYCPELIDYASLPAADNVKAYPYPGFPEGVVEVQSKNEGDASTIYAEERLRYVGNKVAEWLELPHIPAEVTGAQLYSAYKALMVAGGAKNSATGEICHACLVPALIGLEGKRVEVLDDFGDNFRYHVGRSNGWLPVHVHMLREGACRIPNGIKQARVLKQGRN